MQNRIFSTDSPKAVKADKFGYLNAIHYLAPFNLSGANLCPHASPACAAACLGWTSGQAGMVHNAASKRVQGNPVRQSRLDKARRFMRDRAGYMRDVVRSIELAEKAAARKGKKLCVRLNGSSDIAWEGVAVERFGNRIRNVFEAFPHVQFVDYTKNHTRLKRALPANYHLTLSRSEVNEAQCVEALAAGHNVAVVFERRPADWFGYRVIDGDQHDLRHLDPKGGVVVGLSPKGRVAKKDTSGFVVRSMHGAAPLAHVLDTIATTGE